MATRAWILTATAAVLAGALLALGPVPAGGATLMLLCLGALAAEMWAGALDEERARPGLLSVAPALYLAAALAPGAGAAAVLAVVLAGTGLRAVLSRGDPEERWRLALVDGLPPLVAALPLMPGTGSPVAVAFAVVLYLALAFTLPDFLDAGRRRPPLLVGLVIVTGGALGRLMAGHPWWGLWLAPMLAVLQWFCMAGLPHLRLPRGFPLRRSSVRAAPKVKRQR